jgi:hypothetical protein
MTRHLTRVACAHVISGVLARRGINPRVRPVSIDAMTALAREVRHELDRIGANPDVVATCFEVLVEEVINHTMTGAGHKIAFEQLAAGFRVEPQKH